MMQELDILTFPLQGFHLIEASAGTGKTFTIANLYLRLIVEQRRSVEDVLVVTFTQAATEELRDRIRSRLKDALRAFERGASGDELLSVMLDKVQDRNKASIHLRDQLTLMDQAAIFTIHGFCKRMLQEHAFASGALFDMEFITSQGELLKGIIEDFWRRGFYGMDEKRASWIMKQWSMPHELLGNISGYLNKGELAILPHLPAGWEEGLERSFMEAFSLCRDAWQTGREDIQEILYQDQGLSRAEKTYRKDRVDGAVAAWEVFLEHPHMPDLPPLFELFTSGKLATSLKKNAVTPVHVFFDHGQTLKDVSERWQRQLRIQVLADAMEFCRRELVRRKHLQNVMSFDDLLSMLHDALHKPSGDALANGIGRQYPVALIDEFQDTDALQYAIFRRIYHGRDGCGLFLIGDPKQAIYSFRGADIFAYMRARHDAGKADRYTLKTNWRSTTPMVAAVNAVFDVDHAPFIYDEDIPFHRAHASGRADRDVLRIDGRQLPALCVWNLPLSDENQYQGGIKKEWARKELARACASEIAMLLDKGTCGAALMGETPLVARDIAVLVRNGAQASLVQEALREVSIASAVISRESIFATGEADELGAVLAAVAEPGSERLIRAALCTELLGIRGNDLDAMSSDEIRWEQRLQQFHSYNDLWRQHGFMLMFHSVLHEQGIPRRLLAQADGDRRLTNLLQLGELLQAASQGQHGMEGLLHWFREQRSSSDGNDEEQQLRLESDEALVKIVTIHKSKGLEYPVVFLPYLWDARPLKSGEPLLFHDGQGRQLLDLGSDDYPDHSSAAAREILAEELRLLYVALTRAKYRCVIGWGKMKDAEHSGLAYLLYPPRHPGEPSSMSGMDGMAVRAPLERLALQHPEAIEIVAAPSGADHTDMPEKIENDELSARIFSGHIERDWHISSYTSLASGRLQIHDADHDEGPVSGGTEKEVPAGIFAFPRGAQAGSFLHAVFERLDFPRARGAVLTAEISRQLMRHGYDQEWLPVLESMVGHVLDARLDDNNTLRLRDIERSGKRVEMEFHYPLAPLAAERLEGLLHEFAVYESDTPALNFKPTRGMMTGFIDLVIEHRGRFYIVDYKSNHLGDRPEDYALAHLERAMIEHRYDLQYLIYSVALHRYLARRIHDYDYERHFGGVYYLFVRGICAQGDQRHGIHHARPARQLIESLDRLFSGRLEEATR